MMSVQAFARDYIRTWEDGGSDDPKKTLSLDRNDPGNWTGAVCGKGVLTGSQHGVTPWTLAAYRGCAVDAITPEIMRGLTLDEAAAIALKTYYQAPGLARLSWDPVVASVMDFGWTAGPRQAIRILQRTIGVAVDGAIGPNTIHAYDQWVASRGIENAARDWAQRRNGFYQALAVKDPRNNRFLKGWMNRTAYFTPGAPWWARVQVAT